MYQKRKTKNKAAFSKFKKVGLKKRHKSLSLYEDLNAISFQLSLDNLNTFYSSRKVYNKVKI